MNNTKIFPALWSIWEFSLKTLLEEPSKIFNLKSTFLSFTYQEICGVYKDSLCINIIFKYYIYFSMAVCMHLYIGDYARISDRLLVKQDILKGCPTLPWQVQQSLSFVSAFSNLESILSAVKTKTLSWPVAILFHKESKLHVE